jgi:hypothetical protein
MFGQLTSWGTRYCLVYTEHCPVYTEHCPVYTGQSGAPQTGASFLFTPILLDLISFLTLR